MHPYKKAVGLRQRLALMMTWLSTCLQRERQQSDGMRRGQDDPRWGQQREMIERHRRQGGRHDG